ncbi:acyl-CoA N-acyltransferase [Nitzschia inconspicua]|uniref:Acyl-CoA N-acyltransferase n=1 Tax=Nitzschia inconspicua TaxID=303405 RepID=A0A9K3L178_9STRA|nr:acyl-CoA N-acyltransferase [Nitzschia inconspicua]
MSNRRRFVFSVIVALLDALVILQSEFTSSLALVVTSPRWEGDRTHDLPRSMEGVSEETNASHPKLQLRIRSTATEDIPTISTILSRALLKEEEKPRHKYEPQPAFNFKRKMEFLRTKAGVVSLLHSRMEAIAVGRKIWQMVSSESSLKGLDEKDKLRYLWSSEIFRNKLEKACKLSDEPHSWKNYNFACAPESMEQLFHKMLTAENVATGEIIGFCEVAMLSQPKHWCSVDGSNEVTERSFTEESVPTIVNLVTSAKYRRRGVASSIVRSASRYVGIQGCSKELALYVEQNNKGAVQLYERLGFKSKNDSANQLYMKAPVAKQATGSEEIALLA